MLFRQIKQHLEKPSGIGIFGPNVRVARCTDTTVLGMEGQPMQCGSPPINR